MRLIVLCIAVAIINGCSTFPWFKQPPPEPTVVKVPELYCPLITIVNRPEPINQSAPKFMAVTKSDARLNAGATLICLTDESYEQLADMMEAFIIYGSATQAILDHYEKSIAKQQSNSDE